MSIKFKIILCIGALGLFVVLRSGRDVRVRITPVDQRPALVVASFVSVLSAGTESQRTPIGLQITQADADGWVTLKPPLSLSIGSLHTKIIVSKAGYEVKRQTLKDRSEVKISLSPATRFEEERLGFWSIRRDALYGWEMEKFCKSHRKQCSLARNHVAEREAYLAKTYPQELAAWVPPPPIDLVFDGTQLSHLNRRLFGVAQLGDDFFAVVTRGEKSGRSIHLYRAGALIQTFALADDASYFDHAALGFSAKGYLSVYDQEAVKRLEGETLHPLPLRPSPEHRIVSALLDGPEGPVLAVTHDGVSLWRYRPDGVRLLVTPVPDLKNVWSLVPGRNGDVLVVGPARSDTAYAPRIDGLIPNDPMPRKAFWVPADGGGEVRAVAGGFDFAVPTKDGYWAIWLNLIQPKDERTARMGFSRAVARHFARRCDTSDVCEPSVPLAGADVISHSSKVRLVPTTKKDNLLVVDIESWLDSEGDVVRLGF